MKVYVSWSQHRQYCPLTYTFIGERSKERVRVKKNWNPPQTAKVDTSKHLSALQGKAVIYFFDFFSFVVVIWRCEKSQVTGTAGLVYLGWWLTPDSTLLTCYVLSSFKSPLTTMRMRVPWCSFVFSRTSQVLFSKRLLWLWGSPNLDKYAERIGAKYTPFRRHTLYCSWMLFLSFLAVLSTNAPESSQRNWHRNGQGVLTCHMYDVTCNMHDVIGQIVFIFIHFPDEILSLWILSQRSTRKELSYQYGQDQNSK